MNTEVKIIERSNMSKPNIVLITCHDIGQHLNCYGVKTVNSPNLDKLAEKGVMFKNSFCTAPQCSPSRAALHTGRYPHNNGVMGLTHADFAWDMNPDEKHICAILRENGWQSHLVGCQHETRYPKNMGFDSIVKPENGRFFNKAIEEYTPGPPPCENVTRSACELLDEIEKDERPFYLQVGYFEPHRPLDYDDAKPDTSKGLTVPDYLVADEVAKTQFAQYQGLIKKVDAAIGNFIDHVKSKPYAENTIIIYTADHGIPFTKAKCTLYDAGIEVPLIIDWPKANLKPGTVYDQMISNIDCTPTILDMMGVKIPENIQGKSFAPLLKGQSYEENEHIFAEMTYHQYYDPIRCIRSKKYKLIANFCCNPLFQDPNQDYKNRVITKIPKEPAWEYKKPFELYDLESDPNETVNIYDKMAEDKTIAELKSHLFKWMNETNDPLLKGIPVSPMHNDVIKELEVSS